MKLSSCHQTLPVMMALLAGTAAAQNITPGERQQAIQDLNESRDGVVQAMKGLSAAQWKFKPGPTRWPVAEVVEHLALNENFFLQAPEQAVPTGRWTPQETLKRFLGEREQTAAFSSSATDLRAHSVDHPAFGPLDGYQWVLAVAAHTSRHTQQILEVKADPNFPAN